MESKYGSFSGRTPTLEEEIMGQTFRKDSFLDYEIDDYIGHLSSSLNNVLN